MEDNFKYFRFSDTKIFISYFFLSDSFYCDSYLVFRHVKMNVMFALYLSFSGIIRIVGKISANKSSTLPTTTTEIHIETPKVIFDHQNNVDKGGSSSGNQNGGHDPLILQLKQTAFPLIGPNYKLVIRDGEDEFVVNQTVPMPKCLYNGKLKGNDSVNVAISTCDQNKIVSW